MWRDFEKEKPLGHRSVFVRMDLEINKGRPMDINKILAEVGKLYLEVVQLREQLAMAQAKLTELLSKPAESTKS